MRLDETMHFIDPQGKIHLSNTEETKMEKVMHIKYIQPKWKYEARAEMLLNDEHNMIQNIHMVPSDLKISSSALLCLDCNYCTERTLEATLTV